VEQGRLCTHTHQAGGWYAVLEHNQGRDRRHLKPSRRQRVCVYVKLRHGQLISMVDGELFKDRCNRATRPAPRGPEINQYRFRAVEDVVRERSIADRDGTRWGHEEMFPFLAMESNEGQCGWPSQRWASSAAAQPLAAAVTAWR